MPNEKWRWKKRSPEKKRSHQQYIRIINQPNNQRLSPFFGQCAVQCVHLIHNMSNCVPYCCVRYFYLSLRCCTTAHFRWCWWWRQTTICTRRYFVVCMHHHNHKYMCVCVFVLFVYLLLLAIARHLFFFDFVISCYLRSAISIAYIFLRVSPFIYLVVGAFGFIVVVVVGSCSPLFFRSTFVGCCVYRFHLFTQWIVCGFYCVFGCVLSASSTSE